MPESWFVFQVSVGKKPDRHMVFDIDRQEASLAEADKAKSRV